MRLLIAMGMALFSIFRGVGSYASGASETVTELAMSASDVAVVEVVRRVPVEFEYLGEKRVCGYRIESRVLESFKGEAVRIDFVDPLEGDPTETKNRYLVFAFPQLNEINDPQPATSLYEAESRCFISASTRLVRAQPRTLLRLVGASASQEDWVFVRSGDHVDVAMLRWKPAEVPDEGHLVSWEDVRHEIERTLEAMRHSESKPKPPAGSSE